LDTVVPAGTVKVVPKVAPSRSISVDPIDRRILEVLQRDGRITNAALAEQVSLSESACLRRVHALERSGLISGYGARIDPEKVGLPVSVFVSITLDRQDQTDLKVFEDAVRRIPEVMECYLMTGDFDYLVRVAVADTADFELVHSQVLTRLPGVARVHSSFALRTVTRVSALPIR
jgi:Lrp/AsnC family transcriptional regulator, leucine-responsive regulatory protein